MHVAINEEAKRLARMIDEYLDITRLEAGARPLRKAPLRVQPLVERALFAAGPARIVSRNFRSPANLTGTCCGHGRPGLAGSGAHKCRRQRDQVQSASRRGRVSVRTDGNDLLIEVADKGRIGKSHPNT